MSTEKGIRYNEDPERIGKEFDEFRKSHYFPEDFPGVAQGVVPSKNREIQIIRKNINVDLKKRDGMYAPCNLCRTTSKWLHGGYLILDDLGYLYLIGPDCGHGHFPDFIVVDRKFDKDLAYNRAYDFLYGEIGNVSKISERTRELVPFAETFERALSNLKKSVSVFKVLRRVVNKQDGNLLVYAPRQEIAANGGGISGEYFEVIGKLSGGIALNGFGKNSAVSQLYEAIEIYGKYGDSENSAFEFLAREEAKNRDSIAELAAEFHGANAKVVEAYKMLRAAQEFFSYRNLEAIVHWIEHPECPEDFKIDIGKNHRMVWASNSRKHFRIEVEELLNPLPPPPIK